MKRKNIILYHATPENNLPDILKNGIHKGSDGYVWFAKKPETALWVVSLRHDTFTRFCIIPVRISRGIYVTMRLSYFTCNNDIPVRCIDRKNIIHEYRYERSHYYSEYWYSKKKYDTALTPYYLLNKAFKEGRQQGLNS